MATGFICQVCGIEAPAKYVEFYYNIGAVVARFKRGVRGNLCKRCIHKQFWKCTALDLTLGWWGMISMIITPIFFFNNVIRYLGAMSLPTPEPGAAAPRVTEKEIGKLAAFREELVSRLNQKELAGTVVPDVAGRAGVTPGQVVLYLRMLSQNQVAAPQQKTGGFPVVMKEEIPVAAIAGQSAAGEGVGGPGAPPALPPLAVVGEEDGLAVGEEPKREAPPENLLGI